MKYTLILLFGASFMLTGCGTSARLESRSGSPTPVNRNVASGNTIGTNTSMTPASLTPSSGMVNAGNAPLPVNGPLPKNMMANMANIPPASGQTPVEGTPMSKAKVRDRPDVNPSATPVPPQMADAPENSQFGSTMQRDGTIMEIRAFRNNPKLTRVEAVWSSPEEKLFRFYLPNGRVSELKVKSPGDLRTMSSAQLLKLAAKGRMATAPAGPKTGHE